MAGEHRRTRCSECKEMFQSTREPWFMLESHEAAYIERKWFCSLPCLRVAVSRRMKRETPLVRMESKP
jgi:hypothetical protein